MGCGRGPWERGPVISASSRTAAATEPGGRGDVSAAALLLRLARATSRGGRSRAQRSQPLTSVNPALKGSARKGVPMGDGGLTQSPRLGQPARCGADSWGSIPITRTALTCSPRSEVLFNGWERRLEQAGRVASPRDVAPTAITTTAFCFRYHGGSHWGTGDYPALRCDRRRGVSDEHGSDAA
jgi:hypothetical protein